MKNNAWPLSYFVVQGPGFAPKVCEDRDEAQGWANFITENGCLGDIEAVLYKKAGPPAKLNSTKASKPAPKGATTTPTKGAKGKAK